MAVSLRNSIQKLIFACLFILYLVLFLLSVALTFIFLCCRFLNTDFSKLSHNIFIVVFIFDKCYVEYYFCILIANFYYVFVPYFFHFSHSLFFFHIVNIYLKVCTCTGSSLYMHQLYKLLQKIFMVDYIFR